MEIILFILFLLLVGQIASLGNRVRKLEQMLGHTAPATPLYSPADLAAMRDPNVGVAPGMTPLVPAGTAATTPSFTPAATSVPTGASAESQVMRFLKEDFLVKLGALLLLFAFGWGVSYAFANNWIGPIGRITLGLVTGLAFMAFATVWMKKQFHQAMIFLILGLGIFNLTIFAARFMYDLMNPFFAMVLMFVAVAYVAGISVLKNSQNVALAALMFGGIAPLFTAGEPSTLGLFSYLFLFVIGVMWVVYVRQWHALTFAALITVSLYSAPYLIGVGAIADAELILGLVFAQVFSALFFLFNGLTIVRSVSLQHEHIYTGLGIGFFITAWVLVPTQGLSETLVLSLWALLHFVVAGYFYFVRHNLPAFYLYGSVGLFFTAVATSLLFDGHTLTLAYTIQSGLVVLLAHLVIGRAELTSRLSFLFIGPGLLALSSITAPTWSAGVFHADFFVLLTFILSAGLTGLCIRVVPGLSPRTEVALVYRTLLYTAGAYFLMLVWLVAHATFASVDVAVTVSLLIFTACGLCLYIYGRSTNIAHYQYAGGVVIALVIGRLLLVDVWRMQLLERFITFFIIGGLLMSTAFYGRKQKSPTVQVPPAQQ